MARVSNLVVDLIAASTGQDGGNAAMRLFHALGPFGAVAINARAYHLPADNLAEQVMARAAPAAFMPVYQQDRFFRDNPLPGAARTALHPFAWSEAPWHTPGAAWVRATMRDCGCPDGLIVPCHGPGHYLGVVSLAFTDLPGIAPEERRAIELAAHFVHGQIRLQPGAARPDPGLTRREADCLRFVSEGCTNAAIAEKMGVSRATVATHLANARAKLGARTRAQAVAALLAMTFRA